jgi:hypothetical protein
LLSVAINALLCLFQFSMASEEVCLAALAGFLFAFFALKYRRLS